MLRYWNIHVTYVYSRVSVVDEQVEASVLLLIDSLKQLFDFLVFRVVALHGNAPASSRLDLELERKLLNYDLHLKTLLNSPLEQFLVVSPASRHSFPASGLQIP